MPDDVILPIVVDMEVETADVEFDMEVDTFIKANDPPAGTVLITENGITDVGQYANASVIVLDSYKYAQELGAIW